MKTNDVPSQPMAPAELADLEKLAGYPLTEEQAVAFRRRKLEGEALERELEYRGGCSELGGTEQGANDE